MRHLYKILFTVSQKTSWERFFRIETYNINVTRKYCGTLYMTVTASWQSGANSAQKMWTLIWKILKRDTEHEDTESAFII